LASCLCKSYAGAALGLSVARIRLTISRGADRECKVLTPADLSAATKGKVSSTVGGGVGAAACMWVIDAPSGAGTYQLFLEEAKIIEAVVSVKNAGDKETKVPGLWTEAYLKPPGPSGDAYILTVLKRGEMAIEVHGVNKDAVIALAKVATSRLN
jgi:hypothetical protein